MLPLLTAVADCEEHKTREVIGKLAAEFQLTEAERTELLPSGNNVFENLQLNYSCFSRHCY